MNQKELKREINSKRLKNLYIFCGDDYFLKKLYRDRVVNSGDFELEFMDINSEDEIKNVLEYANTKRLFGSTQKRVIYAKIHYVLSFVNIENNSGNVIILDPVGCKNIRHKNVVKFERPDEDEVRRFIIFKLKGEHKTIENKALKFVVEKFMSKDTSSLNLFLESVLLYDVTKKSIGYDDVVRLYENVHKADIFKLIDYIVKNDKDGFFDKLDIVLNSASPSFVIAVLTNEILKISLAGFTDGEKSDAFGLGKNLSKYKHYFSVIGRKKLLLLTYILHDMDLSVKSSNANGFSELLKVRMFEWFNNDRLSF